MLSDIIASAAKSVSCSADGPNKGPDIFISKHQNSSSQPCWLYDRWLEKYNSTNSTMNSFTTETDANNIDGFKVPGMQFFIIYFLCFVCEHAKLYNLNTDSISFFVFDRPKNGFFVRLVKF